MDFVDYMFWKLVVIAVLAFLYGAFGGLRNK